MWSTWDYSLRSNQKRWSLRERSFVDGAITCDRCDPTTRLHFTDCPSLRERYRLRMGVGGIMVLNPGHGVMPLKSESGRLPRILREIYCSENQGSNNARRDRSYVSRYILNGDICLCPKYPTNADLTLSRATWIRWDLINPICLSSSPQHNLECTLLTPSQIVLGNTPRLFTFAQVLQIYLHALNIPSRSRLETILVTAGRIL